MIDKEKSTHLYVSGVIKGANQGVDIFVTKLLNLGLESVKKQIKKDDTLLFDEMACFVPEKNNFHLPQNFVLIVIDIVFLEMTIPYMILLCAKFFPILLMFIWMKNIGKK